jgi:hypothetical protein
VPSASLRWEPLALDAGARLARLDLRVAVPDLFGERLTRLRLTPLAGFTLPVTGRRVTAVTFGVQLERRFGPIEIAWRTEGSKSAVIEGWQAPQSAALLNRLLVEGWLLPYVSASIRFDLVSRWLEPELVFPSGPPPTLRQADAFVTAVQLNFALHALAGFTFSMETSMPAGLAFPFYAVGREAENLTTFLVRLWLRSDARLQRNWLDR